jgi:hypothetical protein
VLVGEVRNIFTAGELSATAQHSYVALELDGLKKRSSYNGNIFSMSNNPVFEELFTFQIKPSQFHTGTLRIQVRHQCACLRVRE